MTIGKEISSNYSRRFGQVAVEQGYVSQACLKRALCLQVDDDLSGRQHRLLGTIMFENDWMTSEQIEQVLNLMLSQIKAEKVETAL